MSTRTITIEALAELSEQASAQVFRAVGDLDAVCEGLGDFGQEPVSFERSWSLDKRAATLRALAAHAMSASIALSDSAASYDLQARFVERSSLSLSEAGSSRASKVVGGKSAKRAKTAKVRRAR